jgi:hypothetical protein
MTAYMGLRGAALLLILASRIWHVAGSHSCREADLCPAQRSVARPRSGRAATVDDAFYWSVSRETQERIAELDSLNTEVDVIVHAYRRVPNAGGEESTQ